MNGVQSLSVSLRVSADIGWWVRPYLSFMSYVASRGIAVKAETVKRTMMRGIHVKAEIIPQVDRYA